MNVYLAQSVTGQNNQQVIDRVVAPVATEAPIEVPGGATVMLLNNHVTPFEVVLEALMFGTGLAHAECYRRMMKTHTNGWHPIASYGSADIAQSVADKITRHAAANGTYEKYRPIVKHSGPWPLDTEVMDAQQ